MSALTTEQRQQIERVFCDVLEKFSFLFGEPADKLDVLRPEGQPLRVSMTFTGAGKGSGCG